MIYCFFSRSKSYDICHSSMSKGFGIADGLQYNGKAAAVLWGGCDCEIKGVKHFNYKNVLLRNDDVIINYGNVLGDDLSQDSIKGIIGAGRKIWYPCYVSWYSGDFYDSIIIENPLYVNAVQSRSTANVVGCLFGAQHRSQREYSTPYPRGGRNIFFAGRLMANGDASQVTAIRRLADKLPDDYNIWVASSCILAPAEGYGNGLLFTSSADHVGGGCSFLGNGLISLPICDFISMCSDIFDNDKIRVLGPLPYGTFDDYIFNADCVIDFGFDGIAPGPNCKILEPLSMGVPVVADGYSFSFFLILEHGAGVIVPYRDADAMADAIISIPKLTSEEKMKIGRDFCLTDSWRSRAKQLIELLEI